MRRRPAPARRRGVGVQRAFVPWAASLGANEPRVERDDAGFTVRWTSPTAGEVRFGSAGAFTVDGEEVEITDFPRHDSTFGRVDHLATSYDPASKTATLTLDFVSQTRSVGAAP